MYFSCLRGILPDPESNYKYIYKYLQVSIQSSSTYDYISTKNIFTKESGEWIKVHRAEVNALPAHSKNLVETHCLFDDDYYYLPDYGFKKLDIVIFLNHSDHPNIISVNDGVYFETIRDILCGEELLIDYGTIVESTE